MLVDVKVEETEALEDCDEDSDILGLELGVTDRDWLGVIDRD